MAFGCLITKREDYTAEDTTQFGSKTKEIILCYRRLKWSCWPGFVLQRDAVQVARGEKIGMVLCKTGP